MGWYAHLPMVDAPREPRDHPAPPAEVPEEVAANAERLRAEEELRQAEERMRSVVDHVIDGIITIDDRGRVDSFNPAAEKLFGYSREEVLGRNVNMLMPEPYHHEHDAYLANYMRTGQARIIGIGREVVGRRKDGSTFPMELAVSEFHIGARRYFTGIVRDITERKELERQLRQRLDELAQADRQKNEFLAMLAHELRNPLAPMRNALHLLNSPKADEPVRERARQIMDRQMHHLVRLVDDLLDVSRIVRGMVELRRSVIDLSDAVLRAAETAQPVIDGQGHELVVSLPDEPLWVDGDIVRLGQVIANLLTNAAKYTDQAGLIHLSALREDGDAVVRVRDPGIGIPPEALPHVFELFVQGDRSLARSQGGLGIGLTLVQRLVELHGGRVEAHSEGRGQGSEFVVRLPSVRAPHAAAPRVEPRAPRHAKVPASRPKRVLVVDDNIDAADSIVLILRGAGYEVNCVYDGPSVLPAARHFRPDVVVLDIGLPGMDGYEVARQLRAQQEFRSTPLVAVTGYGQAEDRVRSREAGFDAHLTKPVNPQQLQQFIAKPRARTRA
jgi:two-component system CheB/CheR fusion protein